MVEEKSPKENKKMSISCNSWKKMTNMTSSCSRTKQSKRAEVLGEGPSASASPEVMKVNRSYLKPEKKHSAAKNATDGVKRASTLL